MNSRIREWWNKLSSKYQADAGIHTKSAHYGPYAPDENELNLLGDVKGKKILELGCGGGQCSIAFAKDGADCTGIDISSEQLKYAKELASKENVKIKLFEQDIQTLGGFDSDKYDIVFSAFAFMYIENLSECFKEVFRVLKPSGIFVFSIEHPFFAIFDQKTQQIKRSYFVTGRYERKQNQPDGSSQPFVAYRRKISDIFNSLADADFIVEKIIEPLALNKKAWSKVYTSSFAKLVGPTIIFKSKKLTNSD